MKEWTLQCTHTGLIVLQLGQEEEEKHETKIKNLMVRHKQYDCE